MTTVTPDAPAAAPAAPGPAVAARLVEGPQALSVGAGGGCRAARSQSRHQQPGNFWSSSDRVAPARPRCSTCSAVSMPQRTGKWPLTATTPRWSRGPRVDALPARAGGVRLPVLQSHSDAHGCREYRVRPRAGGARRPSASPREPQSCSIRWAWQNARIIFPAGYRAGNSSASPLPARWQRTRRCFCATSRRATWISARESGCSRSCAR